MSGRSVRLLPVGACLSAIATAGTGQTTADPASLPGGLGEIIVTATRRQEIARDVPVAVSAISGDTLDALNASGLDIRFLSSRVPSLQIESSFGRTFPRFYIRGLGNTDFDPNSAQPVSVVYDDVALENPLLKSLPVFDLQSVRVLRGPQGTLFGRNTPAGVVKLDPVLPSDTYNGYAMAEYGTYNTVNGEAAVGGPIGDGLSFRISGLLQRRDNWVRNQDDDGVASRRLEGYTDVTGRAQLQYKSGDFTARVEGHYRHLDGTPRVFRAGLFEPGSNRFSPGFDKDEVALDGYTSQTLKQYGGNLHLDYRFEGLGTLYSITAYERARVESSGDIDGGDAYVFPALGLDNALFPDTAGGVTRPREFSQEVRFASDYFGRFRIQAGAYYFHQRLGYREFAYGTTTGNRAADLDQDIKHDELNENYGVFASGEYKVSDDFTLRAGVRYSHDHKRDVIADGFPNGVASANVFPPTTLPSSLAVSASDVTWDASATYALSSQVNLYARGATGYLGPAIQDRVTFGSFQNAAPKETTISGEAGIKGETVDRTVTVALDGYWYRTRHFQLTAVGGATNSARLLSADHVVGYGAELEVQARPLPNLTLTASGSYNFTEIRDKSLTVGVCGALCTVTDPEGVINGTTVAFINGNDLPQAPRYVANATLRYEVPFANGSKAFFSTDWAYRGKINYFLYNALEFHGRALTEGGAELGYQFAGGLTVSVFARNITDQIRSISAIDFNNLTGMINDPRIVGGKVRFAFR